MSTERKLTNASRKLLKFLIESKSPIYIVSKEHGNETEYGDHFTLSQLLEAGVFKLDTENDRAWIPSETEYVMVEPCYTGIAINVSGTSFMIDEKAPIQFTLCEEARVDLAQNGWL